MGRKNHSKSAKSISKQTKEGNEETGKRAATFKLSPQKRNEVNQLIEKLLKVSSVSPSATPNVGKEWELHLEIENILNKIIHFESELKNPLPLRTASAGGAELIAWLEANSGQVNGVTIAEYAAGAGGGPDLGLRAERDLTEGELIVAVPRRVMLTLEAAHASPLGALLGSDAMLRHMPNVALALLLLVERFRTDSPSFWLPYLAMLPRAYTTVLYFSTPQLQELKGSPALEAALRQCRNIARQYAYFNRLFQNTTDPASEILREIFTYEQYRWAVSTVMTRQNFIPSSDASTTVNALIPFWDMANHANGKLTTDYSLTSERSECSACRDYVAGEQVCIFYGARSNADLLVHNGFVSQDNQHDSLRLRLGIARSDPLQAPRTTLLTRLGLPTAGDFTLLAGSQPVHPRLLAFLRVFSMAKEHLDHWLASDRCLDLEYPDCALDTEVETRAWAFLLARVKLLALAYPTTLEADQSLLTNEPQMETCRRLAILLRITEKRILRGAEDYVQQRSKP